MEANLNPQSASVFYASEDAMKAIEAMSDRMKSANAQVAVVAIATVVTGVAYFAARKVINKQLSKIVSRVKDKAAESV